MGATARILGLRTLLGIGSLVISTAPNDVFAQIDLKTSIIAIEGVVATTETSALIEMGVTLTVRFSVEHASGTSFLNGDEFNTTAGVPPAQSSVLRKQSMSSDSENVPCSLAGCTGRIFTGEAVTFTTTFLAESAGLATLSIGTSPNLRSDTNLDNNLKEIEAEVVEQAAADLVLAIDDVAGALEFDPTPPKIAHVPLGESSTILISVRNDGPDAAGSVVITGGGDPDFFAFTSVLVLPSTTCELGTGGAFFSCANLTVASGDTLIVEATGAGVATTPGIGFSTSTGHPNESDFSDNDDAMTLVVEDVAVVGSAAGTVWLDLDANGVFDGATEQGLVGRVMFADINDNRTFDAGVEPFDSTDAGGNYELNELPFDSVSIVLMLDEEWEFTVPADGFQLVDFSDDQQQEGVNQGTRPKPGAILGAKWKDVDKDGIFDQGEPVLEDWRIYLDINNNGMLDDGEPSKLTDANGLYAFGNLDPGTYTVREVQQPGFVTTFPTPEQHTVAVVAGQFIGGRSFGNRPVNSIHGEKYEDLNGDGTRDEGEPGLNGVMIVLSDPETFAEVARTTSMAMDVDGNVVDGLFWFGDVDAGVYSMLEETPFSFVVTEPSETQGPFGPWNVHRVVLSEGSAMDGFRFGNRRTADVTIAKEHLIVGDKRSFRMTVVSTGDSPGTVVTDTLDANVELISFTTSKGECTFDATERVLTCNLGDLASDEMVEVIVMVRSTGDAADRLNNTGYVRGDLFDPDLVDNRSSASGRPEFNIEKSASSEMVQIGDTIVYTITTTAIAGLVVTDTLAQKVEFISASSDRYDCTFDSSTRTVRCSTFSDSRQLSTITIRAKAVAAGECVNVATGRREPFFDAVTEIQADTVLVVIDGQATPTESPTGMPEAFSLLGSYPNPFTLGTTIRFDLPSSSTIRIDVFDLLGRRVLELPERNMAAGSQRAIRLDAARLTSGLYFYRVFAVSKADSFVGQGSFVLIR